MNEEEEEDYWNRLEEACKDAGEAWDDERMDIIGQNGNDGLHYVVINDDGTTCRVQHKMKYAPEFGPLRDGVKEP